MRSPVVSSSCGPGGPPFFSVAGRDLGEVSAPHTEVPALGTSEKLLGTLPWIPTMLEEANSRLGAPSGGCSINCRGKKVSRKIDAVLPHPV